MVPAALRHFGRHVAQVGRSGRAARDPEGLLHRGPLSVRLPRPLREGQDPLLLRALHAHPQGRQQDQRRGVALPPRRPDFGSGGEWTPGPRRVGREAALERDPDGRDAARVRRLRQVLRGQCRRFREALQRRRVRQGAPAGRVGGEAKHPAEALLLPRLPHGLPVGRRHHLRLRADWPEVCGAADLRHREVLRRLRQHDAARLHPLAWH
mmetsp:Transcript_72374/g.156520  ORF Transcript_72374/g.156520 Transcript_72374/m.156520 type:complete len:209 (+) Transcript_72374:1453-2079(+)